MEVPLFRLRVLILVVILLNIFNEVMSVYMSKAHMTMVPAVLFTFMIEMTGLIMGAVLGRDMNKIMIFYFDIMAVLMFGTIAWMLFKQMGGRNLHEAIVLDGVIPLLLVFLYGADLCLSCLYLQDWVEVQQREMNQMY